VQLAMERSVWKTLREQDAQAGFDYNGEKVRRAQPERLGWTAAGLLHVTQRLAVQVAEIKAENDWERLSAQEDAMQRQFDRWKRPTHLLTSRERRPYIKPRMVGFARQALRTTIHSAALGAQAQVCSDDM
jgi:hypothetical protein